MTADQPANPKVGNLVRNERQRRWGQVVWDAKKWQFETGTPCRILVWDTERRGTMDWPLADVSVVVEKGKIVWENPDLAAQLDAEWRATERWNGEWTDSEGLESPETAA